MCFFIITNAFVVSTMYAIGIGKNKEEILKAYEKLKKDNIQVTLIDDSQELVDMVLNNEVEGAVRGTLSSSEVIPYLNKKIGKFYRASILKNPLKEGIFLLAPVGIDEICEENGINDKLQIIKYSAKFLKNYKIEPKIGILSGGRLSDYGRSKKVDETMDECENIINHIKNNPGEYNNIFIRHNGILIEEYLKDGFNVILAPDGISGNLMFRCLGLVCGLEGYGAILLTDKNIKFIDTSRGGDWTRYYNAIKFLEYGEIGEI
ncbi:MAG: hypothetical protein PWP15_354 [Methanothermococcus sp.]|nr:hypothetical protein [Methanothermococcus sp.]MDK2987975.1 hypothetical protein [Methanothermococcus sp.]